MAVWEMCRFKGSDVVMLMGSMEQRGLDSAAHSNVSAGILPQDKSFNFAPRWYPATNRR